MGPNIAEHCDPGNVNDALRAQMANVAAFRDLVGGAVTTTGSSNAFVLTSGLGLTAYGQGLLVGFEANHTKILLSFFGVYGLSRGVTAIAAAVIGRRRS